MGLALPSDRALIQPRRVLASLARARLPPLASSPQPAMNDVDEDGNGSPARGVADVGIIWLRCSAELRARWRAIVVTALLVGIGGGVALSAFGGARRTDTAMASFVSYSRPDDGGFIYGNPSHPTVPPGPAAYSLAPSGAVRRIVSLPQVKAWFEAPYLFMATDPSGSDVGTLNPIGFSTAEALRDVDRPLVVAGHLPGIRVVPSTWRSTSSRPTSATCTSAAVSASTPTRTRRYPAPPSSPRAWPKGVPKARRSR